MNITKEQKGDLNALLTIDVAPDDYKPQVEQSLKKLSKQVSMKGFRKGMVPKSLVKKMYGNQVLAEELDKIIQDQLNTYLKENELEILGQPLPTDDMDYNIDVDAESNYAFKYELGLSPEFEVSFLDKKTKIKQYDIEVSDEMIQEEIDQIQKQFGKTTNPEDAVQEDDVLYAELTELDDKGETKDGGVTNKVPVALDMVNDKDKKALLKLKVGESTTIKNIFDLLKDKEKAATAKHLLDLKEDQLEGVGEQFSFTLEKINRVEPAELNEELYKQLFGEETEVKDEAGLRAKIKEEIAKALEKQSEQRLGYDMVTELLKDTKIELPEDFLKRWIKKTNEKPITDEQLENEFEAFTRNLRWNLIVNKLSKEQDIKIEPEDIKAHTKEQILAQFGNLGGNFPDEQLDQWAESMLQNKEHVQKTYEQLLDQKLIEYMKDQITVEKKKISLDDFKKLD